MLAQAETAEYLAEIRDQVCSHCVERPEGGPPCTVQGKVCGIELHLPSLIESIHQVHSSMIDPYLRHNRQNLCERCTYLHGSSCPCPMDYLAVLLVQAVETVDRRRGGKPTRPRREIEPAANGPARLDRIRRAFDEAKGTWTGCDWPTRFGKRDLDLNGWTPADAEAAAARTENAEERADWLEASEWLERLEAHCRWAEQQAELAVAAAEDGRWMEALQRVQWLRSLEFSTGRNLRRTEPPTWDPLGEAIESAASAYLAPKAEALTVVI